LAHLSVLEGKKDRIIKGRGRKREGGGEGRGVK